MKKRNKMIFIVIFITFFMIGYFIGINDTSSINTDDNYEEINEILKRGKDK